MADIFEIMDKTSRRIRLTHKQWASHIIRRHPEVSSQKDKIAETLEKPDKIISSMRDENVRYYYRHYQKNFEFTTH